jgi:hypothetical protein
MQTVVYRRTTTANETASKVGEFIIIVLFVVALVVAGAIRSE